MTDSIPNSKRQSRRKWPSWLRLPGFSQRAIKAEAIVDAGASIGEINPRLFGHLVEQRERGVYDGVWNEDGSELRPDVLTLVKELKPAMLRYPGGVAAGRSHWEDGIEPLDQRKPAENGEGGRVGTDEFLAFCREAHAEPSLAVNAVTGAPEEAARWVAYCNEPATGEQGRRRAGADHAEPYGVRLWAISRETAEPHTALSAEEYAARVKAFATAMRAADPNIELVAAGEAVTSDSPSDAGRRWNETLLREAGDWIDCLAIRHHLPGRSGWTGAGDDYALHYTLCAAPLDLEKIIQRTSGQVKMLVPGRKIGIAIDPWSIAPLDLFAEKTPATSDYSMREALYSASLLNVFIRQCRTLSMACHSQLVNTLPLIVTSGRRSYTTALFHPFLLYQRMEKVALKVEMNSPTFESDGMDCIAAHSDVPYIDMIATRSTDRKRIVLGIVNRHSNTRAYFRVRLRNCDDMLPVRGWLLDAKRPQDVNSLDEPQKIRSREVKLPSTLRKRDQVYLDLPPASVSIMVLE